MDTNKPSNPISLLRPDTALLWSALQDHPMLKGFILVGGTALTMHIGHRVSEDLDFACTEPLKHLPKAQIKELTRALSLKGVDLVLNQNPLDVEEFEESGLDLNNYQQNFIANGSVKVSLVCYDPPMDMLLPGTRSDPLRVATLDEIFSTKAFVCSERSKSRDWLDLYVLLTQHGYDFNNIHHVYQTINRMPAFASMSMRLRSCRVNTSDEGFLHLLKTPPSMDEMRDFFNQGLDDLETHLAKQAFSI